MPLEKLKVRQRVYGSSVNSPMYLIWMKVSLRIYMLKFFPKYYNMVVIGYKPFKTVITITWGFKMEPNPNVAGAIIRGNVNTKDIKGKCV